MKNQGFIGKNQHGNALVIILIMIALLAALTLTLTRMGQNTTDMSQEQAQTIATQVLRQARTMANATDGLIAKGCSVNQLSFDNTTVTGYTNAQSPSDKSCWLFDAAGAGLNFPTSPITSNASSIWHFSRSLYVPGVGSERETLAMGTLGTCPASSPNCQEIVAVLPFVDLSTCKAINVLTGVTSSFSTAPPVELGLFPLNYNFYAPSAAATISNFSSVPFNNTGAIASSLTQSLDVFWDKKAGCTEVANGYRDTSGNAQTGTGIYFFYQVLLER